MYENVDDTLLAHHAYASHLPQRLDQLVSEYCDASPWKLQHGMRDAGEKGAVIERMGGEELCLYNAQDVRLTSLVWARLQSDLAPERTVYEHDRHLARICGEMSWAGLGVDQARRAEIIQACRARAEFLTARLREIVGNPSFDPGKPAQVRRYLYPSPNTPVTRRTEGGLPSTDNATLEGLVSDTPLGRFARGLLKLRVVSKVQSTYLDAVNVCARTGRAHYMWKPFGTVSGRLASRIQSCPRWSARTKSGEETPEGRPRELYVPARGNVFVYFDVSQAEMRLAAFLSADPAFMKVASESDVHSGNASIVFPDVAAKGWLSDKQAKVDPARGKPYRDIAKNLGFAISYGAEADKVHQTLTRKGFRVSYSAVEGILRKLRTAYKVYYKYVADNLARVREVGYMRSPLLGRIRWFGWYPKPTDIANYPVQSALADIVNMRMIELDARLRASSLPALLVAQIHDACIYEVPTARASELEELIQESWARSVTLAGGELVLPIDMKRGERWSDF